MSDRRPPCFEGRFLWHPIPDDAEPDEQYDYLPPNVFAALTGHIQRDNAARVDLVVKAYYSRAAAMEAYRRAVQSTIAAVMRRSNAPRD